eukprot:872187-Prorocentrum_minimum.AAC.1
MANFVHFRPGRCELRGGGSWAPGQATRRDGRAAITSTLILPPPRQVPCEAEEVGRRQPRGTDEVVGAWLADWGQGVAAAAAVVATCTFAVAFVFRMTQHSPGKAVVATCTFAVAFVLRETQ